MNVFSMPRGAEEGSSLPEKITVGAGEGAVGAATAAGTEAEPRKGRGARASLRRVCCVV